jgi:hypothetical protein
VGEVDEDDVGEAEVTEVAVETGAVLVVELAGVKMEVGGP